MFHGLLVCKWVCNLCMQNILDKLTGQSQVEGAGKLAVPDWMLDRVRLYYGFIRNNDSDVSSDETLDYPPGPHAFSLPSVACLCSSCMAFWSGT